MAKPNENSADCGGPKYDAPGVVSAACLACGKCDAVRQLLRELVPANAANNQTMRIAQATR